VRCKKGFFVMNVIAEYSMKFFIIMQAEFSFQQEVFFTAFQNLYLIKIIKFIC
jgi:hypothetical protein